jgi:hypothetical protein
MTAVMTSSVLLIFAKAWQFTESRKTRGLGEDGVAPPDSETLDLIPTTPDPEQPSLALPSTFSQDHAERGLLTSASWLLTRKTMSLRMASLELGLLGAAGSLVHTVGLSEVRLIAHHHHA